jgi:hypothetical protein
VPGHGHKQRSWALCSASSAIILYTTAHHPVWHPGTAASSQGITEFMAQAGSEDGDHCPLHARSG